MQASIKTNEDGITTITAEWSDRPSITDIGNFSVSTRGGKSTNDGGTITATYYRPATTVEVLERYDPPTIRESFSRIRREIQAKNEGAKRAKAIPACWHGAYLIVTGAEADPRDADKCNGHATAFIDAQARQTLQAQYAPQPQQPQPQHHNGQHTNRIAEHVS